MLRKLGYLAIVVLALIVTGWALANRHTVETSMYIASICISVIASLWAIEKASQIEI